MRRAPVECRGEPSQIRAAVREFVDLDNIEQVGLSSSYAEAEEAWRGKAQRTVDDAEMKYVVVHLHRLLEPDAEPAPDNVPRSNADIQAPR